MRSGDIRVLLATVEYASIVLPIFPGRGTCQVACLEIFRIPYPDIRGSLPIAPDLPRHTLASRSRDKGRIGHSTRPSQGGRRLRVLLVHS
jgi:hypothetical protein